MNQRKHIMFSEKTLKRLLKYINDNFSNHNVTSMIVDKAVTEYLDRQEQSKI